jgi:hypothetical protein
VRSWISATDFCRIYSKLAKIRPVVGFICADSSELRPVWKNFGQLGRYSTKIGGGNSTARVRPVLNEFRPIKNYCVCWESVTFYWSFELLCKQSDSILGRCRFKMRKSFPIQMMNQGWFTFCQKLFRSNDYSSKKHSVKWSFYEKKHSVKLTFGHFSKKAFGQMNFWSYVISAIWLVFQVRFSVKWPFSKYFRPFDKFCFEPNDFFGKMNFRSNGLRLDADSVKCTFGQMAFGQTVFGQMVFRSNGLSVKKFNWNHFSVKWSRTTSLCNYGKKQNQSKIESRNLK